MKISIQKEVTDITGEHNLLQFVSGSPERYLPGAWSSWTLEKLCPCRRLPRPFMEPILGLGMPTPAS